MSGVDQVGILVAAAKGARAGGADAVADHLTAQLALGEAILELDAGQKAITELLEEREKSDALLLAGAEAVLKRVEELERHIRPKDRNWIDRILGSGEELEKRVADVETKVEHPLQVVDEAALLDVRERLDKLEQKRGQA